MNWQNNLIKEIYDLVEETCKNSSSKPYTAWTHHILIVYEIAKDLAIKYDADIEICELSALLHDYSSVSWIWPQEDHHIYGAKLSEEILLRYAYPKEKIEHVKSCILTHRWSKRMEFESLEAQIIANADAMAHFYCVDSLLYLAYIVHKMNVDEWTKWVLNKLENSYNKLSSDAKELIEPRYEAIKMIYIKN